LPNWGGLSGIACGGGSVVVGKAGIVLDAGACSATGAGLDASSDCLFKYHQAPPTEAADATAPAAIPPTTAHGLVRAAA